MGEFESIDNMYLFVFGSSIIWDNVNQTIRCIFGSRIIWDNVNQAIICIFDLVGETRGRV